MEKEAILIMLATKLDEYGVPEEDILRNVKMFERYLDGMTPRELEHELKNIDINVIADRIYNIIAKKKKPVNRAGIAVEPAPQPTKTIKVIPSASRLARTQSEDTKVRLEPIQYEKVEKAPPPINFESLEMVPDIEEDDEEPVKASWLFWLFFLISLPLTVPILLGIFLVYLSVFLAIAAAIAGLVAVLVAIVASGSALALIGVIYGITQTFSALPIGLFELGLGLIIGGTAMLVGILIYNFAVRFLPFLIKKFLQFTIYSLHMLRRLFVHLKKESVKR